MTESEDIELDFRPFFDLAMGVLFVLLILLASQFFIARVMDATDTQAQSAQRLLERRHQADLETKAFFDYAERTARDAGIALSIDRSEGRLSVEMTERDDAGQFSRVASFLYKIFGCAAGLTGSDCPVYEAIRLEEVDIDGSSAPAAVPVGLSADAEARLRASLSFAQLLTSFPQLLTLRSTAGSLLVRQAATTSGLGPRRSASLSIHVAIRTR